VGATDTPIGFVPIEGDLNVDGLEIDPTALLELTVGQAAAWRTEVPLIEEHFAQFGERLPDELRHQLTTWRSGSANHSWGGSGTCPLPAGQHRVELIGNVFVIELERRARATPR